MTFDSERTGLTFFHLEAEFVDRVVSVNQQNYPVKYIYDKRECALAVHGGCEEIYVSYEKIFKMNPIDEIELEAVSNLYIEFLNDKVKNGELLESRRDFVLTHGVWFLHTVWHHFFDTNAVVLEVADNVNTYISKGSYVTYVQGETDRVSVEKAFENYEKILNYIYDALKDLNVASYSEREFEYFIGITENLKAFVRSL